ncbi:MAG: putative deoxyribonuclease YjjV [Pseudomonadota bacterium]|jgi:TatD DNase family protein
MWIDTHVHLDAPEFNGMGRDGVVRTPLQVRSDALAAGVTTCIIPAVEVANFDAVRQLAHQCSDSLIGCDDFYALGIHPLYVPRASENDLTVLAQQLEKYKTDKRLVAVGEIGLDFFVPELCTPEMRERQWHFYREQLKLAQAFDLPVILHVRRSADILLKGLREVKVKGGIAHAFNGSKQQAQAFIDLGFKLGFGGAMTFERALQIRELARTLPLEAIVLETDAPDIPPQWLYRSSHDREEGAAQGINAPGELFRIAQHLSALRGAPLDVIAASLKRNCKQLLDSAG